MDRGEIEEFLRKGRFTTVIDATHPFAVEATRNIKAAVNALRKEGMPVSYLRLKREEAGRQEGNVVYFRTGKECAQALEGTEGKILLTTGSRELSLYCRSEALRNRLYVRILPCAESIALCAEQGICGKQIIAMQGPFTTQMNEAIIRQYNISYVVSKESGASGGYPEKREAARRTKAKLFVIGRPQEEGSSFGEICGELEKRCGRKLGRKGSLEIILAGVGCGGKGDLTREAERAVEEADIVMGAERILAGFPQKHTKYPFYRPEQVVSHLQKMEGTESFFEQRKAVVLFSGDSGFYSGCQSLYDALEKEIRRGNLQASVRILPGISSVAYLAACLGESYHDADICSMHGKKVCNLINRIGRNPKTFLLTSGVEDVREIGRKLLDAKMTACQVITGFGLSYAEQEIRHLTPGECMEVEKEGLYTCLIKNPCAGGGRLTHGLSDGQFIRGNVPMTKEEVREAGICKLHLRKGDVVYDIGSGTGSVAVEIAGLSDDIRVYAVEQREEAASLIEKNRKKFGLENIQVVKAAAPEGFKDLPAPARAFIGGSNGRLKEILSALLEKNGRMRVVITAVSLETICEIREILSLYKTEEEEVLQMQVSRGQKAGSHYLMRAENPVWICAFTFGGG